MNTIKIADFSNEAASQKKGIELNNLMEPFLLKCESFTVDFSGISRFASPFFNNSFAKLALVYGFDKINSINKINISETGIMAYQTSLDNALLLSEKPEFSERINIIINNNLPKKDD